MTPTNKPTSLTTTINRERTLTDKVDEAIACLAKASVSGMTAMYLETEDSPNSNQRKGSKVILQMFSTQDAGLISAITGGVPVSPDETEQD
jgi:hypothetical protein